MRAKPRQRRLGRVRGSGRTVSREAPSTSLAPVPPNVPAWLARRTGSASAIPRSRPGYPYLVKGDPLPISTLRSGERVALIANRVADPKRLDLERLAKGGEAEDRELASQGLAEWVAALEEEDRR